MAIGLRPPHHLGYGFALLVPPVALVDDPSLDVVVDLELDVEGDRLVITRFAVERRPGGPPITMDVLKSLPLVRLAAKAATDGVLTGLVHVTTTNGTTTVTPAHASEIEALPEIDRTAVAYRAALFFGLPPTVTVAEMLGVSRDVAAKRVQAARRAGLLEPTTKGKKGA